MWSTHFGTIGAGVAPFCRALGIPLVVSFYGFDLAIDPADLKLQRAYAEDVFLAWRGLHR